MRARPGQPADLPALLESDQHQRAQHDHDGPGRGDPAARWHSRPMRAGRRRGPLPGARDPHRHPVRGQQQQGQQVEQPDRGDRRPIAGPPAPPAVSERVQQQPCSGRREHGDQPVGTRVLGVPGHLRGGHEQQPRHDSGQGGRGQSAGLGKMPANRRYEHSRHRHRQHRRPPQRGLRRSRHGGPDVHEHVVGAVDRISVTRQREDPRQRAAGRVHRVGLITPQRNPPQPVTINQQHHQPGNQQRHPARHLAYPARLIGAPPHQVNATVAELAPGSRGGAGTRRRACWAAAVQAGNFSSFSSHRRSRCL